jgi:hypothetical protein
MILRDNFLTGEEVCETTQKIEGFKFWKKNRPKIGSREKEEDKEK